MNTALAAAVAQKNLAKIPVLPVDILRSAELQQQIAALMEGAVLQRASQVSTRPVGRVLPSKSYFPDHRAPYLDHVFDSNAATWSDEMCILTGRTAFVMPSHGARHDELRYSARLELAIENIPTVENPGTGRITAQSIVAALHDLVSPIRIGT